MESFWKTVNGLYSEQTTEQSCLLRQSIFGNFANFGIFQQKNNTLEIFSLDSFTKINTREKYFETHLQHVLAEIN